jgi:AraC-like DNA-binding protein
MRDVLTTLGATTFDAAMTGEAEAVGNYLQLADLGLGFWSNDARTEVGFPESDFARLQITLKGGSVTRQGGIEVTTDADLPSIVPPGGATHIAFEPGFQQLILRIDATALESSLATLIGAKPRGRLILDPLAPATGPGAALLRDLTLVLARQFRSGVPELPAAVLHELKQALVAAFLSACRHNFSGLLEADARDTSPRAVRLAEEFIESSWDRAITIEDLAAQTDTSIRSLYAAFRRSRGYTPMAFAKTVRLRRSRQMLMEEGQRNSVSAAAFRCGFGNLGHFARDYRAMFGELPSDTLRRVRRDG